MSSGILDSVRRRPRPASGAAMIILGILIIISHVPPMFRVRLVVSLLLAVLLPSLLGLVLVGIGYLTIGGTLVEAEDAFRLSGWTLVGMVVFLFVGIWILVLDVLLGQPVPYGYLLTINTVSLGGVVGVIIGLYDCRRREHARTLARREVELERQNERLDEFAGVVSHDLRNPLNVAAGKLEMANDECDSEHLADVSRALDRMDALIDDLLEFAREGGNLQANEAVRLARIGEQCWEGTRTEGASLRIETDRTIVADRGRLRQVLENLFRNAVEHGGADVTVTLGGLANGFYVEDDGSGIPADERENVFEAGYSSTPDGTGFGLSIVKEIVQAHGWEIAVTEGVEGGARFEITGVDMPDD